MNLLSALGLALASFEPGTLSGSRLRKVGEKLATLAAMEHGCNAIRDEAMYEDVRQMLAEALDLNAAEVQNMLSLLGDVAHEMKTSV